MASSQKSVESGVDTQGLEDLEFITMSGYQFVSVHLGEQGWERQQGFLERRQRREPVAVDRRRGADEA